MAESFAALQRVHRSCTEVLRETTAVARGAVAEATVGRSAQRRRSSRTTPGRTAELGH
ncbi:hypothetical protein B1M_27806, partial [Burkholderia sp. TJI49]